MSKRVSFQSFRLIADRLGMAHTTARAFNEKFIKNHDSYSLADPFFTQAMVDVLKALKFRISSDRSAVNKLIPDLDQFCYRAVNNSLPSRRNWQVEGLDVYHQGIHSLFSAKFKGKLKGRPQITLLNECMGLGIEVYLTSSLAARFSFDEDQFLHCQRFRESAQRIGKPYQKTFDEAKRNPFDTYKRTVVEAFVLYQKLFDILKLPLSKRRKALHKFNSELKKSKYVMFHAIYIMSVPPLFLAAHCGFSSNDKDKAQTRTALRILKNARNMKELIGGLGLKNLTGTKA